MRKFESNEYKEKRNAILNQMSELNNDLYECIRDWEQNLKDFIAEFPTNYYRINGCIYIQKKKFESSVVKHGHGKTVKTPISWARFEGIVVYTGKDTIVESFGKYFTLKLGDTVEVIDSNGFNEVFCSVCNKVFADTEENIKWQYENFPFGFYKILEEYPDIFPKFAHKFHKKLEITLDEDIEFNINETS